MANSKFVVKGRLIGIHKLFDYSEGLETRKNRSLIGFQTNDGPIELLVGGLWDQNAYCINGVYEARVDNGKLILIQCVEAVAELGRVLQVPLEHPIREADAEPALIDMPPIVQEVYGRVEEPLVVLPNNPEEEEDDSGLTKEQAFDKIYNALYLEEYDEDGIPREHYSSEKEHDLETISEIIDIVGRAQALPSD